MPLTIGPGVIISGGLTFRDEAAPAALYQLWTWGVNAQGQNGQNDSATTIAQRSSPVQIGSLTNWSLNTKADNSSQTAIKTDGTLWTWGLNNNGQLGLNDAISRSSPVQVGALTNWSKVGDGQSSTGFVALKTDGTLWAWGENGNGNLGLGDVLPRSSPVQIGSDTNWNNVWQGQFQTVASKTDGSVWVWGWNTFGQLGLNDAISRSSPVQLTLPNWSKISVGQGHIMVVKTDGTLWSWGSNNNGRLGQNDTVYRSSPVQIGTDTNWATPFAGQQQSAAIKTTGTAWSWGANQWGQLGQNDANVTKSSPVQIGSATDWSKVLVYGNHAAGLKTNGTLWTWGRNFNGMLGDPAATADRSSPVQLGAATNWAEVRINGTTNITALRTA